MGQFRIVAVAVGALVATGLVIPEVVGAATTPVPTGITPPVLTNRTLYRHNDVVLADRQAGLFRAFRVGAPPTYALQAGATSALTAASPGAAATGDFAGTGVETAVAAHRCAATNTICLKLDTTTPPAGGSAGWQSEFNTTLTLGPLATYPTRIVLAAGKLDGLSPGKDQLAVAWLAPSTANSGGYDLDLAIYAVNPTSASPFTLLALDISTGSGFSAPRVAVVYPDTCAAGQWNGTSGTPPTNASSICANRMPFAMTIGDFGSNDGRNKLAIAWDQTVLGSPGIPPSHQLQAAIYQMFGPYQAALTRSIWPMGGPRTIISSASFSLSLANGRGLGASDTDPRTDLVFAASYDAPNAPYMVLAIPVDYSTATAAYTFSTTGVGNVQIGGCPSSASCIRQGGEISVAVGDVATLTPDLTVPAGVTPASTPSPVASIVGEIPPGSYKWAVRWVRLGPSGRAPISTSPLSPASSSVAIAANKGERVGLPITVPAGWLANIYRAPAASSAASAFRFAGSIRAGTNSFDDTLADGGLGAAIPGNVVPDGRDEIVLARTEPLTTSNEAVARLDVLQTLPGGGLTTIGHATKTARGPSGIAAITVGIGGVDPLPTDPNVLPGDFTSSIVLAWEQPGTTSPTTTGAPAVWSTHVVPGFRCDRIGTNCLSDGGLRTTSTAWVGADDAMPTTYAPNTAIARDPTHFALPDLRGESIRLGAPASRTVAKVPRPKMVIHVPPTQFDRMPPSGSTAVDLLNPMGCFPPTQFVSCWFGDQMDWSVNLEDAATTTLEVKTTKKSGWETAIEGNAGLNIAAIGLSAEASIKKTYGEDFENTDSSSKEFTNTTTVATGPQRDTVLLDYTDYRVDDYPLLGGVGGAAPVAHVVVVTPTAATDSESYSLDTLATLQPLLTRFFRDHNPGNILSYPDSAAVLAHSDGSPWVGAPHDFAPFSAKTWELEWKQLTGVNSSASWSSKIEAGGGFGLELGPVKLELKIEGTTTEGGVAEESTSVATTMKLKAQNGDVTSGWDFTLAPTVYRDKDTGILTLDWLIDLPVPSLTARCDSQIVGGWSKYYQGPCDRSSSSPVEVGDLAFAMPFRTVPLWIGPSGPPDLSGWSTDRNEALYTPDIRIDAPASAYANPIGDCTAPCAALQASGSVPISATVHNYSLDPVLLRTTAAGAPLPPKVRFFQGGPRGSFPIPIGDGVLNLPNQCVQTVFRSATPCLLPRGASTASVSWTIPPFAAGHLVSIYAVIDPDNQYPELHDWAQPWNPASYLGVYTDPAAADPVPNNEAWNQFQIGGTPGDGVDLNVANDGDVIRGLSGTCGHVTCVTVTVQGDTTAKRNASIADLLLYDGDPRTGASAAPLVRLQRQIDAAPALNRVTLTADVPLQNDPWVVVKPLTHWDGDLTNNLGTVSTNVPKTNGVPVISPTPGVGSYAACLPGEWAPAPASFDYSWLRDDAPIPNATDQLYVVSEADGGHALRCRVTAHSASGDGFAQSAPSTVTAPIAGSPVPQTDASLTPSPTAGTTVTCDPGSWLPAPVKYTYAWLRKGAPVLQIGSGSTYFVQNSDVGTDLACQVTAQNAAGWHTASSAWSSVPVTVPKVATPPSITGLPGAGVTLTCLAGTWYGAPSFDFTFQWSADGLPIPFANTATHLVTADEVNSTFTCTVTALDGAGSASFTSAPAVRPTVPQAPSLVALAGDARATLTVTPGADGGLPIDHYTVHCTPACGATAPETASGSYVLTGLSNGVTYTLTVSAHNAIGDSANSNAVDVTPRAPVPTPKEPDPPALAATAGDGSASLVITPRGNGGAAVDSYAVQCSPVCGSSVPTTSSTRFVLRGLRNATAYRITVTAHNLAGNSRPSNAVTVTPHSSAVPTAPSLIVLSGDRSATVLITPGRPSGGAPIDHFSLRCAPACGVITTSKNLYVVTRLKNGRAYTITATAHNAAGNSKGSRQVRFTPFKPRASIKLRPSLLVVPVSGKASFAATCGVVTGKVRSCSIVIRGTTGKAFGTKKLRPPAPRRVVIGRVAINLAAATAAAAPGGALATVTATITLANGKKLKAMTAVKLTRGGS